jgi:O-antigen/teichoic acid export membrane protein
MELKLNSLRKVRRRWLGNSAANLVGGLAMAGVNIILPALIAKHTSSIEFSVWNIALQIIIYVNILGLGLQTATARSIAHASDAAVDNHHELVSILAASRSIAHWASAVAVVLIGALLLLYPMLFPGVPPDFIGPFRWTLVCFGLGATLQIMAQPYMGVFQGLHRNVIFVAVQFGARALAIALVWWGVRAGQPMTVLAALLAGATATVFPLMRLVFRKLLPWARLVREAALDVARRRDLLNYCLTLSTWSLSMLFVNSSGIVVVGHLNLPMVGPYSIAMSAANVVVGLLGALLAPLLTTAAALYAQPTTRTDIPRLLWRSTLGVAVMLNVLVVLVLMLDATIIRHWVGARFVATAAPLLAMLVAAHCLRNIAAPYALMLVATGLHRRGLLSSVFEAAANVAGSVVFGIYYGALGVAFGTLVGSVVGVAGAFVFNVRATPEITPEPIKYVGSTVVLPTLLFLPLQVYLFGKL